ncbi:hypothetical protein [Candidatus Cetobacterium colombiensis]|uniref:Uncharacterized protein n=1 Tax=Candidatus Cetobacterium colombiensis TaxID=3073100 RepID=A0ABU4W7Y9_9FUSO|nr:hypothetical protein [Candidatus Cetobacterium colombiensis]MDX8335300.1 hypothetical protein [Candidatus Cetobacterium colombiensis]
MDRTQFIKYAQEVVLTVLKITLVQLDKLKEMGDLSGVEILEEKVLIPYERIYGALLEMKIDKMSEEEFKSFEEMVEEIREKNNLSIEKIKIDLEKREKLKNKSGAMVVKKFFNYNLNRFLDKKDKIAEKYNSLATEEQNLENLLKDTVQEEEQFDIIYRLQPVREKLRDVENKYLVVEKDINQLKKKLESKWPYEIYGVISEEELLETYKEAFKMED